MKRPSIKFIRLRNIYGKKWWEGEILVRQIQSPHKSRKGRMFGVPLLSPQSKNSSQDSGSYKNGVIFHRLPSDIFLLSQPKRRPTNSDKKSKTFGQTHVRISENTRAFLLDFWIRMDLYSDLPVGIIPATFILISLRIISREKGAVSQLR